MDVTSVIGAFRVNCEKRLKACVSFIIRNNLTVFTPIKL